MFTAVSLSTRMTASDKSSAAPVPTSDSRPLWDAWLSGFHLPALTVADEIGVFALLDEKSETTGSAAEQLGISVHACETLLGFLAAHGYLRKERDSFSLTLLSREYLLPSSPYYWGGVLHTVREMPVSHAMIRNAILHHGAPGEKSSFRKFTDDWTEDSLELDKARSFTRKMHSHGIAAARTLARTPYFAGIENLLDVGGGSGCYSMSLVAAHPRMRCTIAELPAVCPVTREYIDESPAADRIEVLPLDMFRDRWPGNRDAVFFSDIFHDWEPETCLVLARKAYSSIRPGGRIYLHEALLNEDSVGPKTINAYDLAMLMVTQGKQYTATHLTDLLETAGFEAISVNPAHGYYSLIVGKKPGTDRV